MIGLGIFFYIFQVVNEGVIEFVYKFFNFEEIFKREDRGIIVFFKVE